MPRNMFHFALVCFISLVSLAKCLPAADDKSVCSRRGRSVNPFECGSFYDCVEDDLALSLIRFKRSCYSGAFNPATGRCGRSTDVEGCSARRGRHYDSTPRYDYLCKDGKVSFACADCQTQITCSEGRAYVTKCESNLRCVTNAPDFDGGVCHTHFDDECRCTEPNSYRQDPFSNSTFFLCEAEDAIPTYYNCPMGMYFDETSKTCVNNDGSPACTTRGLFTFPENCSKYYMCTLAIEGWVQTKMTCPQGQLFNKESERCEDPCTWEVKEFKCEIQGRFKNPKDCQKFTECIDDSKGGLLAMERRCPPGFHWNDEGKNCIVRSLSQCNKQHDGPLKKCRKDFDEICKAKPQVSLPDVTPEKPELSEEDTAVPELPVNIPAVEENPVEVSPELEEKPVEVEPVVAEKPAEVVPVVDEKPVDITPEEKPSEVVVPVVEENPSETAPVVEEKPVEEAPAVVVEKPAVEVKPATEEKPEEVAPVTEEKPTDVLPVVEEKPTVVAPVTDEKPTDVLPVVEEKPAVVAPVTTDEKPTYVLPVVEEKPADVLPVVEEKPVETAPAVEVQPVETAPVTNPSPSENEVLSPQGGLIPVSVVPGNKRTG